MYPFVTIFVFNFDLVFGNFFVIFHIFFGKYTLTYLLIQLNLEMIQLKHHEIKCLNKCHL